MRGFAGPRPRPWMGTHSASEGKPSSLQQNDTTAQFIVSLSGTLAPHEHFSLLGGEGAEKDHRRTVCVHKDTQAQKCAVTSTLAISPVSSSFPSHHEKVPIQALSDYSSPLGTQMPRRKNSCKEGPCQKQTNMHTNEAYTYTMACMHGWGAFSQTSPVQYTHTHTKIMQRHNMIRMPLENMHENHTDKHTHTHTHIHTKPPRTHKAFPSPQI